MTIWLLILLAQPPTHQQCQQCHTEAASDVESHPHFAKAVSCDACHGKSEKHVAATGHAAPDRVATREQVPPLCGTCHPAQRKAYDTSRHSAVLKAGQKSAHCATCHGNHSLRTTKAIQTSCARCHPKLPDACAASQGCDPHTLTSLAASLIHRPRQKPVQ